MLLIVLASGASAQEVPDAEATATPPDVLSETVDDQSEDSYRDEMLSDLELNPLDANAASREELQMLPELAESVIEALIENRTERPFRSLAEAIERTHADDESARAIRRYLVVGTHIRPLAETVTRVRSSGASSFEPEGGGPFQWTHAAKFSGDLRTSAAGDEGVGAKFGVRTAGNLPTIRSASVQSWFSTIGIHSAGLLLIAGDYFVESGEGLVLARRSIRDQAWSLAGARSHSDGIRAAAGPTVGPLHGVGITFTSGEGGVQTFFSSRSLRGTAGEDGAMIQVSERDFHPPSRGRSVRTSVDERMAGVLAHISPLPGFRAGMSLVNARWSRQIALIGRNHQTVAGIEGSFRMIDASIHGELSASEPGAVAWATGGIWTISPYAEAVAGVRHYQKGFVSPCGNGPSSGRDQGQEETGWTLGMRVHPSERVVVAITADQFSMGPDLAWNGTPWSGHDLLFCVNSRLGTRSWLEVQLRDRVRKDISSDDEYDGRHIGIVHRRVSGRVAVRHAVLRNVESVTRVDWVAVSRLQSGRGGRGLACRQEIHALVAARLRMFASVTVYRTTDSDARMNLAETGLPGTPSLFQVGGDGIRWSIVLQAPIVEGLKLSARFVHDTREEAGRTAPESFRGDSGTNRIGFQIDAVLPVL